MKIDDFFDKIFIINLKESRDRWENTIEELRRCDIRNYERFNAIRPNLDEIPKEIYKDFISHQKIHDYFIVGQCGCKLSHVQIMKIAKSRKYNNILILEDDICIDENINEIFEKAYNQFINIDWKLIYLGYSYNIKPEKIDENIICAKELFTTHAYAINNFLFDLVIDNAEKSGLEIDNYYRLFIQSYHNCIGITPRPIWQKSGESIILQDYRDTMEATREEF